jgi:hypothetical protein
MIFGLSETIDPKKSFSSYHLTVISRYLRRMAFGPWPLSSSLWSLIQRPKTNGQRPSSQMTTENCQMTNGK